MDKELCPLCGQEFDLVTLLDHAPSCDGSVFSSSRRTGGGGGGGGSRGTGTAARGALSDEDLARQMQADWDDDGETVSKRARIDLTGVGKATSGHTAGTRGGSAASTGLSEEDAASLALARQLQEEEERAASTVQCGLCSKMVSMDKLYILDECSHKFCRGCLAQHINAKIATAVAVTCPLDSCDATLSVRDVKELIGESMSGAPSADGTPPPGKPSKGRQEHANLLKGIIPTSGTPQATERLLAELKHIMDSDPEKNGFKVKPVKDNLYHWEVKLFGFDKTEPLAQDMVKQKVKDIVLNCIFPQSFPFAPPYIRVIRPRFQFRTGHVTLGGSICMEVLTNMGWSPANTLEAILISIRAQLIAGNARLDSSNKSDYTPAEAKEAFDRMMASHGWW